MATPVLETKLFAPRARRGIVPRARLEARLTAGATTALTLVSAPAGFGKTTLLGELARSSAARASVAWVSLDAADNDPTLFWTYVVAALDRAAPGVAEGTKAVLEGAQSRRDAVVATLLNDLVAARGDIVLILDDYHAIDALDVQDEFAFFIDHLPPAIRIVIGARADPALPLARLRAGGHLTEIRAADLRFTADEAASYLNGVLGLDLTTNDVEALEQRTEGWIAALQLAGLSMQGREDLPGFIAGFAGDDRYIVDYLVEEVLHRQTDDVRGFLLETSILARMTGSLCDAVTGRDGGASMLAALERSNLFVVSLDDRRRWYRYHHLFADVLQARLMAERSGTVDALHRRASDWFDANGDAIEAIRHAIAGRAFDRAAALIELAVPAAQQLRQDTTRRRWLEALPDELIRRRPVLSNTFAASLLVRGETQGVEERLRDAERWLEEPAGSVAFVDEAAFRDLPASVAVHRAGLARLNGDVAGTMTHASRAMELVTAEDHLSRGGAAALLGLTYWEVGDLDAAYRWYAEGQSSLERIGYLSDVVGGCITLGDIRVAQGRLEDALRIYGRGLGIASDGDRILRGASDMHVGIAEIARERNDLETARRQLQAARELGDEHGLPQHPYRYRAAMARLRQAEGDLDATIDLLTDAERVYDGDFSPNVRPLPARIARVRLAQGRLAEASAWARRHGLEVSDELAYVREYEHATLARLLAARRRAGAGPAANADARAAVDLTERLVVAATAGGRNGAALDVLIAQALAHHALGSTADAMASLARAIDLAQPEGYVRVFLDEGQPMTALLQHAARQPDTPAYVRTLLAATAGVDQRAPAQPGLIEPLSERELDVLRLLRSELGGPDIARELSVSLNTLRTHTRNVYAKLGVNSRRGAVRRATELDLP